MFIDFRNAVQYFMLQVCKHSIDKCLYWLIIFEPLVMIILQHFLVNEAETRKSIFISFHPFSLDGEVPYSY